MSDTAAPLWDFALRHEWRDGARRFVLDWVWCGDAPRLVLLGESGAGKSQSLRLLAGLLRAQQGHFRLRGQALFDSALGLHRPAAQRRIGLLFQDYALFPHLNVQQNLLFGQHAGWRNPPAQARHLSPQQAHLVQHWLGALGLAGLQQAYPAQLSGGQQQRLALARTLAAEPDLLLLDEPFAALDAANRARMRSLLNEWQRRLNLPLLLVSHDTEDVSCFADQVLTLEQGRLLA